jgi:hypothetical protein
VTLGAEIIDFIRLHLLDDSNQVGGICEVAVVKDESWVGFMGILIEVINALGVETASPPLDAMDHIALLE